MGMPKTLAVAECAIGEILLRTVVRKTHRVDAANTDEVS
jgi:hypothetical protein